MCFQLSHTLLNATQTVKCLFAFIFDVKMQDLKLACDMFDRAGEADDGIAGLVVAARKTHGAHGRD